jgi:hypothetical protein
MEVFVHHNQISSFFINMKEGALKRGPFGIINRNVLIFIEICNRFKNLRYLNFSSSSNYEQLTFTIRTPSDFSSNLLELHVVIKTVDDCLCLLDGHFNQLHTLYVTIRPCAVCESKIVGNHVSHSLISLIL